MNTFAEKLEYLNKNQHTWLITGVAGFIGSSLLETLLKHNQRVIGLDDFSTGHQHNLDEVRNHIGDDLWKNFHMIKGDIADLGACQAAMTWLGDETPSVDFVLHHAALGSVPRSLKDPLKTNEANIDGFVNMLVAARDANVKRFIFAASSSTYGDHPTLPKVEDKIGKPLSPYAVTKYVNELYADVFERAYGLQYVGLRYFNVFGPRQDPNGAYAAVIPKWIHAVKTGTEVEIYGDGETSRDFCYVENVVQANILSALNESDEGVNQIYNVAVGDQTTLNQLYEMIKDGLSPHMDTSAQTMSHKDFRDGDVRHSLADTSKIQTRLDYQPSHTIKQGLLETLNWHMEK